MLQGLLYTYRCPRTLRSVPPHYWVANSHRDPRVLALAAAETSTVATEGFANIRTVRAFSSEWLEEKNYERNTGIALRKGMQEAFGSALQNLLSSYTNLAAGILILW